MRTSLTLAQARRAVLAAQGFGRPRGTDRPPVGTRTLATLTRRLGVVQIDSVNVLARAQYLPFVARLGPYDRSLLDAMSARAPRQLFEYWGHEAALLPAESHRLMRWRMERAHTEAWGGMRRIQRDHPGLVADVLAVVAAHGPVTAADVEAILEHDQARDREHWGWNWSQAKRALEYLFWCGEITSAGRDSAFRRRYALPSAVLPAAALAAPTPEPAQAQRELVLQAARAQGVATVADLADHFRLSQAQAGAAVAALVASGELVEVSVPGWPPAYSLPGLRVPRRVTGSALLAPFDPLVWFRPRTERLFGMRYRIEIYTPAHKRVHGYYVLPFLHDEALVARVDLKADRAAGRLLVRGVHGEGEVGAPAVAALADELALMADWLGLSDVAVAPVGDLAGRLSDQVRATP